MITYLQKIVTLIFLTNIVTLCASDQANQYYTEHINGSYYTTEKKADSIIVSHTDGTYAARGRVYALTGKKIAIEIDNHKLFCDKAVFDAGVTVAIGNGDKILYRAPYNRTIVFAHTAGKSLCEFLKEHTS